MRHNQASEPMFRFRLLPSFTLIAGLALCIVAVSSERKPASPAPTVFGDDAGKTGDHTKTGIDVLESEKFVSLRGKRVGLITNQTGMDSQGRRTIDVLAHADGVKLVALFSPEHGIEGKVDAIVGNATDAATGLPIYSLYGDTKRPTDQMLRGIDALVFDVQGAGVRFYTFITTMGYCMEAASKHQIAFFVLDRPDPLGGEKIQGPMLDPERMSFVGYFRMPVIYAMTLGELAQMFNAENRTAVELHIIAMKNWRRSQTYDQTGLKWIPPSPNLRTINEVFLYPGIALMVVGTLLGLWLLPAPRTFGSVTFDVHTMLYCAAMVLLGFQAMAFAVFTKLFAITEGLLPPDPTLDKLFRYITLEVGIGVGSVLLAAGLGTSVFAVRFWEARNFGELDYAHSMRIVIPAVLLLILGVQTVFASFFLSVLGLRRR